MDFNILVGVTIIWGLIIIRYIIKDIYRQKLILKKNIPNLFNELDIIVTNEFNFAVRLPYMAQEFTMITDIKQTINFVTKRAMVAFELSYFDQFKQHGISKDYVMIYIVRKVELLLLEFMSNNNYTTQKKS